MSNSVPGPLPENFKPHFSCVDPTDGILGQIGEFALQVAVLAVGQVCPGAF